MSPYTSSEITSMSELSLWGTQVAIIGATDGLRKSAWRWDCGVTWAAAQQAVGTPLLSVVCCRQPRNEIACECQVLTSGSERRWGSSAGTYQVFENDVRIVIVKTLTQDGSYGGNWWLEKHNDRMRKIYYPLKTRASWELQPESKER